MEADYLGWCLQRKQGSILDLCKRHVVSVTSGGPYFSNQSRTSSCGNTRQTDANTVSENNVRQGSPITNNWQPNCCSKRTAQSRYAVQEQPCLCKQMQTHFWRKSPCTPAAMKLGGGNTTSSSAICCVLQFIVRFAPQGLNTHQFTPPTNTHKSTPTPVHTTAQTGAGGSTVAAARHMHVCIHTYICTCTRTHPNTPTYTCISTNTKGLQTVLTPSFTMYWPLPQSSALMTRTLHEGNVAPASAGAVWPSHVVAVTSCPCDESPRTLPSAGGSAPVATSPRGEYRISIVPVPCSPRTCCCTSVGCLFSTVSCCEISLLGARLHSPSKTVVKHATASQGFKPLLVLYFWRLFVKRKIVPRQNITKDTL